MATAACKAAHGCRKRGTTLKAAWPGWHPRTRLFATRSPVPSQDSSSDRKSLSISSVAVLCWHLLIKHADYQWARPALVANKLRAMELKAGQSARKGSKPGPAYAYNIKVLRDREIELARHAEQAYERFVSQWQPRRAKRRTGAANEERH